MHTQCPKCRTIFNVTEEILAVKSGLVRCGDCDNVFNATWNLVEESEDAESARDAASAATASGGPAGGDGSLAPDADEETPQTRADETDAPASPRVLDPVDDDPLRGGEWTASGSHVVDTPDDDGSDDFVDDMHHEPTDERADDKISDDEIRLALRLDEEFDFYREETTEPESIRVAPDEDLDEPSLPGDGANAGTRREPRLEPRVDQAPGPKLSVSADDGLLPRRTLRKPSPPAPKSPLRRRPAIQLKTPSRPTRQRASTEADAPPAARPDPNVHWVSIPGNDTRGSQFLWASGVLMLIVLVVLQVRFFLVDELYAISATRPYIALFCSLAGCEAPLRSDPGSIEIAQTRVDLHPEVPGAMRIKVNLINRADFAQPYPSLQLTLSDKDGRIVGRRTYTAQEYLDGDGGDALLDPGILAVATINLARPNENAVGFETTVVAAPAR
ncbi:MAG: DUF3426 domain-containing protein [Proteobacteria bacterium]|nr:MAG: DUF3426 domain-containing protein [Pseudomonadota bacterium]